LITLYRYRRRVLCTDSALALTRGSPIGPLAMLWQLDPAWETFTGVCASNGSAAVIGQVHYTPGERSARMAFITPDDEIDQAGLLSLLDSLTARCGSWGAANLLAEVDESSPALEGMRRTGFSVYGWQTIYQFPVGSVESRQEGPWQIAQSVDEIALRALYQSLVPPLVQAAEPYQPGEMPRLVYRLEGELLAYVDSTYGPQGIYLQPVVHPAVKDVRELLGALLAQLPISPARPVYLSARSYQAWLESSLGRLEGSAAPRQALLVKHMALPRRAFQPVGRTVVRESYSPEATVPMARNTSISKN
jgi:hypothetical protein